MYKTIKKMLLQMREELIEEIARNRKMETEELITEIGDLYDSADNERDRQLSHILNDRDRRKLIEIDEALERIDDTTYGICRECGKRITANRLKILPFARLCVPCKSDTEKQVGQYRRVEEEAPYKDLSNIEAEELEE
jgi:RNA polymerase-binding transcription factor